MMLATEGSVKYPAVVDKVNNITCRSLLDTGAGSSYASSPFLKKLNKQPVRKETRMIEMVIHLTVRKIDVFEVKIKDLSGSFQFKSEVSKVERETLLSLPSLNYDPVLKQQQYIRKIAMNDMDKKTE